MSSDPERRESAERELVAAGRPARRVLAVAMRADDVQLRAVAGQLILRIPFDDETDPPAVRTMLGQYGKAPPVTRISYLRPILDGAFDAGPGILLRLMREEPTDEVRWAIVGIFKALLAEGRKLPAVGAFDSVMLDRVPNLALAGWARERTDPAAAMAIYKKAVDLDRDQPSDDAGGQVEMVYEALLGGYLIERKYDEAAGLNRALFARRPTTIDGRDGLTNRLDELFALHARVGPVAGFAEDLKTYAQHLGRPQIAYAVGRIYERRAGQALVADAVYRGAWAGSAGSADARNVTAEFLTNQRFDGLARAELESVLEMERAQNGGADRSVRACNAHLRLGLIAARQEDDAAAALHKRAALVALRGIGGTVTRVKGTRRFAGKEAEDLMWAEVCWHDFRAARAKSDEAGMQAAAEELLKYSPDDHAIALDVMPYLVDAGKTAQAAELFAKPFASAKALLDDRPEDPERLNNLAWFCARGAQRLEEARGWAEKALKGRPDHYAYLDTLAEVHFRLGEVEKAIELEERAIKQRPGDEFLMKQVERFKGKKK